MCSEFESNEDEMEIDNENACFHKRPLQNTEHTYHFKVYNHSILHCWTEKNGRETTETKQEQHTESAQSNAERNRVRFE